MALRLKTICVSVMALLLMAVGLVACDPTPHPNVILIVTDDQTYDTINETVMPFLAHQVATDSKWVTFNKAFLNTAKCCPSRATILTGQYDHHHKVTQGSVAKDFNDGNTLATSLKTVGYHTSLVGKYLNQYPWDKGQGYVPPGWDNWVALENDGDDANDPSAYTGFTLNKNGTVSQPGGYSTDVLGDEAVNFVTQTAEPFFLEFTPRAGHAPWTPDPTPPTPPNPVIDDSAVTDGPAFAKVGDNAPPTNPPPAWLQTCCGTPLSTTAQANARENRKAAFRTIQSADDQIERIWNVLTSRQIQNNTVIIFMTDNGLSLGEHNRVNLKECAYEECIRTPLLVRYPLVDPPVASSPAFVSAIDIAPTILSIAGATTTLPQDGHTFQSILTTTTPPPSDWFKSVLLHWAVPLQDPSAPPAYWGIRTNGWLYTELAAKGSFQAEKELYDLSADRGEQKNLGNDPAYAAKRTELAGEITRLRGNCPAGTVPSC